MRSSSRTWRHVLACTTPVDYLVFQFGPWLVEVPDIQAPGDFELPMTHDELATHARNLTGRVDADGYLVLEAEAPLRLVVQRELGVIGNPAIGEPTIELFDTDQPCGYGQSKASSVERVDGGAQWCDVEAEV